MSTWWPWLRRSRQRLFYMVQQACEAHCQQRCREFAVNIHSPVINCIVSMINRCVSIKPIWNLLNISSLLSMFVNFSAASLAIRGSPCPKSTSCQITWPLPMPSASSRFMASKALVSFRAPRYTLAPLRASSLTVWYPIPELDRFKVMSLCDNVRLRLDVLCSSYENNFSLQV